MIFSQQHIDKSGAMMGDI